MTRRLVYIAGPFRHASQTQVAANVMTAQAAAVALARLGFVPYCPHANLGHAFGQIDEATAEAINDAFLRLSDGIWLLPGWGQSVGARRELELAKSLGLQIFRSAHEVSAWAQR